jgi:hypothetical protein
MSPEKSARISKLASSAFGSKRALDNFWQEIAELHFPEHADFTRKRFDDDWASNLYDSTPALLRREFGNYLGAVLRPKGREWFRGKLRDAETNDLQHVRESLEKGDRRLRSLIYDNRSQSIHANTLADHQYITFGNSVTSITPRPARNGLLYRTWHLRDCAWMEGPDGEVDTMFRKYTSRRANLCAKQSEGWEIPQKVKEKMRDDPDGNIQCMHVEMPIDNYYAGEKPKNKRKTYISLYLCVETNDIMFEEEIDFFRYAVSRWFRLPGSPYAVSPCAVISSPDARTMQSMTYSVMQAGELAVEPPLVGQSEVVLGPVNLFPGGITWVDKAYDERTGDALQPIQLGRVPDLGLALHGALKQQMGDTWYINKLFLPSSNTEMTAQEVERRWQEFMRSTQPIVEPAEPERNGRILDASFQIAMAANLMGSPDDFPDEVWAAGEIDWSYDNPIEDARKQKVMQDFQASMELTMATKEFAPAASSLFDIDQAYSDALEAISPATWRRNPEEMATIARAQEAEKQAAQEAQMMQAGQMAEIAKTAGEADQAFAKAEGQEGAPGPQGAPFPS